MKLEDNQDITITEGITVSNMMRKIPYVRVLIPELNRIVYICNEEGNASFIFDKKFIDENHIVLESLDENSKPDFKDIIELNKNAGVRINQSKNWRERILTALTKNISEFETKTSKINSDLEKRMDYSTPEGFKKLIEEVRLQGIKSSSDYDNKQQENKWPTSKYLKNIFAKLYPGKTFSWDLFLGRDPYSTKEGFRRLVEEVRSKQIKSSGEYGEKQQENKWPVPKTLFKNFTNLYPGKTFSWDLFLARETYSTKEGFKKLIEEVRLQGIKSSSDYNKQKENKWPAYDTLMSIFFKLYPNKTFSWDLFLGREMFILKKQDYESANSLSRKIHSNKYTIKKFAEIYRKDHPEWFEMQKAGVNIAEHYSPELVNIIKEHFENKNGNNTN